MMKRATADDVERATANVEWSVRSLMLKRATAADVERAELMSN